jgi:hypothetical protein
MNCLRTLQSRSAREPLQTTIQSVELIIAVVTDGTTFLREPGEAFSSQQSPFSSSAIRRRRMLRTTCRADRSTDWFANQNCEAPAYGGAKTGSFTATGMKS